MKSVFALFLLTTLAVSVVAPGEFSNTGPVAYSTAKKATTTATNKPTGLRSHESYGNKHVKSEVNVNLEVQHLKSAGTKKGAKMAYKRMAKAIRALGGKVKRLKKKAIGWGKKTALFNKIAKMYGDLDRKVDKMIK